MIIDDERNVDRIMMTRIPLRMVVLVKMMTTKAGGEGDGDGRGCDVEGAASQIEIIDKFPELCGRNLPECAQEL